MHFYPPFMFWILDCVLWIVGLKYLLLRASQKSQVVMYLRIMGNEAPRFFASLRMTDLLVPFLLNIQIIY